MNEKQSEHSKAPAKPDGATRIPLDKGQCPKCSSGKLLPSRKRRGDWVKAILGLTPYRCDRCQERIYRK